MMSVDPSQPSGGPFGGSAVREVHEQQPAQARLWWVNPFTVFWRERISLRAHNFQSERVEVNDCRGNPIEVAEVMLRRQQAEAILAARNTMVQGAVGLVHMALAQLVANLMIVLSGDHSPTPVINTGSLYT